MGDQVPTLGFDEDAKESNRRNAKLRGGGATRFFIHEDASGIDFDGKGQGIAFPGVQPGSDKQRMDEKRCLDADVGREDEGGESRISCGKPQEFIFDGGRGVDFIENEREYPLLTEQAKIEDNGSVGDDGHAHYG